MAKSPRVTSKHTHTLRNTFTRTHHICWHLGLGQKSRWTFCTPARLDSLQGAWLRVYANQSRPCSNHSYLYFSLQINDPPPGWGWLRGSIGDKVKVSPVPRLAGFGGGGGSSVSDSKQVALSLKWFVTGRVTARQGMWQPPPLLLKCQSIALLEVWVSVCVCAAGGCFGPGERLMKNEGRGVCRLGDDSGNIFVWVFVWAVEWGVGTPDILF